MVGGSQAIAPPPDPPALPGVLTALAEAYYHLAFEYLLDQVKDSIRSTPGNRWLFDLDSLKDYPLTVPSAFLNPDPETGLFPLGRELCPVRIDPCHSGWSDIFFLAMDYPQGARVVNISADIGRRGSTPPRPPIECFSRVIDQPEIRLISLDLGISAAISSLDDIFDCKEDELGLLKAGVIASGLVPPAFENTGVSLKSLLKKLAGPGRGLELVTRVHDLPAGSRLAVSTTLLAAVIARLMRQTGQIQSPEGELTDRERRLVASRAILGEWLGGSGGGWQDSGALWPSCKLITGMKAGPGDPEYGRSRGRLLPRYRVIPPKDLPDEIDELLRSGLVLFHGGLAQNVGPILELVTEKYLLRYRREWAARKKELIFFDRIVAALQQGDMAELGRLTTIDWEEGTRVIIPRACDAYTESLIGRMKKKWKKRCRGFLMLGGAAGGGMAFIVDPRIRAEFAEDLLAEMKKLKKTYAAALPFAMEPVVFDFTVNNTGIRGELRTGAAARLPAAYYRLRGGGGKKIFQKGTVESEKFRNRIGFNQSLHQRKKKLMRRGKISIDNNCRYRSVRIEDVVKGDLTVIPDADGDTLRGRYERAGRQSLRDGEAAVVTLAAGMASRWSGGAAVVKALNPFTVMAGRHRSFLEIHLAKSRRIAEAYSRPPPHVITTSFLTHRPIEAFLNAAQNFGYPGPIYLSPSRSVLQRLRPMVRDLKAFWKPRLETSAAAPGREDRKRLRDAMIARAVEEGEGEDFLGDDPARSYYPPGHWYEIPNLIENGTLARMLEKNPGLKYLMVHNTDTLGAALDPVLLGAHIIRGPVLSFEATRRWWGDRGGFLARVNGRLRLLEGLALEKPEVGFGLTYYNSLTTWITIDSFLDVLNLRRDDLFRARRDPRFQSRIVNALRLLGERVPTYLTLKEVRRDLGGGRSRKVLVAQCEKLWGDITGLDEFSVQYIPVDRFRGRQLKNPDRIDHWIREGFRDRVAEICLFSD